MTDADELAAIAALIAAATSALRSRGCARASAGRAASS